MKTVYNKGDTLKIGKYDCVVKYTSGDGYYLDTVGNQDNIFLQFGLKAEDLYSLGTKHEGTFPWCPDQDVLKKVIDFLLSKDPDYKPETVTDDVFVVGKRLGDLPLVNRSITCYEGGAGRRVFSTTGYNLKNRPDQTIRGVTEHYFDVQGFGCGWFKKSDALDKPAQRTSEIVGGAKVCDIPFINERINLYEGTLTNHKKYTGTTYNLHTHYQDRIVKSESDDGFELSGFSGGYFFKKSEALGKPIPAETTSGPVDRTLLIKVTSMERAEVFQRLKDRGEPVRPSYFTYDPITWCYVGFYDTIKEWTVAKNQPTSFGSKVISYAEFMGISASTSTVPSSTLPEKWCIKKDTGNASAVNKWLNEGCSVRSYSATSGYIHYPNYATGSGFKNGDHSSGSIRTGYTEITTQQFMDLVYNPKYSGATSPVSSTSTGPIDYASMAGRWIKWLKNTCNGFNIGDYCQIATCSRGSTTFVGNGYTYTSDRLADGDWQIMPVDFAPSTEEDLLAEAIRLYPAGTKYKCAMYGTSSSTINTVPDSPTIKYFGGEKNKIDIANGRFLYYKDRWAEIIPVSVTSTSSTKPTIEEVKAKFPTGTKIIFAVGHDGTKCEGIVNHETYTLKVYSNGSISAVGYKGYLWAPKDGWATIVEQPKEEALKFKIGDWVYSEKKGGCDYRNAKHIPIFQIADFNSDKSYARPVYGESSGVEVKFLRMCTSAEIPGVSRGPIKVSELKYPMVVKITNEEDYRKLERATNSEGSRYYKESDHYLMKSNGKLNQGRGSAAEYAASRPTGYIIYDFSDLIFPEQTEWQPQKGEYAIMVKAGGWSYSPDNNGCLALITGVNTRSVGFGSKSKTVAAIDGNVINFNKDSCVDFENIPLKNSEGETICRKATQAEIDAVVKEWVPEKGEWCYFLGKAGGGIESGSGHWMPGVIAKFSCMSGIHWEFSTSSGKNMKGSCYNVGKAFRKATQEEIDSATKVEDTSGSMSAKVYPEYYEFIDKDNGSYTKGKIYKIKNPLNLEDYGNFVDDSGVENGYSGTNYTRFKPSTKEAFDKQLESRDKWFIRYTSDITSDMFDKLVKKLKKAYGISFVYHDWTITYDNFKNNKYLRSALSTAEPGWCIDNNSQYIRNEKNIYDFIKKEKQEEMATTEFVKGRWYKNLGGSVRDKYYGKCDKVSGSSMYLTDYIHDKRHYTTTGCLDCRYAEPCSLDEIRQWLPNGHPDKIDLNKLKKGQKVKALIDYPNGGSVKKGEIGTFVNDNDHLVNFPSHKGYYISLESIGTSYELVGSPEDSVPDTEELKKGDWVVVTRDYDHSDQVGKIGQLYENPDGTDIPFHVHNCPGYTRSSDFWCRGVRPATAIEVINKCASSAVGQQGESTELNIKTTGNKLLPLIEVKQREII